MIIRVEPEAFRQVAHAIPKAPASPIGALASVRVEAKGGCLGAYATDLETWVIAHAACSGDDGEVIVPRRLIAALHGAAEAIEIEADGERTVLRSGGVEIGCAAISTDEYPTAPTLIGAGGIEVDADVLRWMKLAASTDETRYNLCGVYFGSRGEIVATDGHRMHVIEAAASVSAKKAQAAFGDGVIMPIGGVDAVIAACGDQAIVRSAGGMIVASARGREGDGEGEGVTVATRAIDGQFPDWQQVVPDRNEVGAKRLRIDARSLSHAVEVIAAATHGRIVGIMIDAADGECVLRIAEGGDGIRGKAKVVPCEGEGSTCVAAKYLLDAVSGVEGEVEAQTVDDITATAWRSAGDTRRAAIIMPRRRDA